jgi:hypothetical protein
VNQPIPKKVICRIKRYECPRIIQGSGKKKNWQIEAQEPADKKHYYGVQPRKWRKGYVNADAARHCQLLWRGSGL